MDATTNRPPKTARTPLQLTARDERIIRMVHAYEGCAVDHLHRRLWLQGSGRSTCYRRVHQLTMAGYLAAVRTAFLVGAGSTRTLLVPGPAARPVLAHLQGTLPTRLPRHRPPARSPLHLAHHLAICDVRVALELAAEQRAGVELEAFLPEIALRRHPLLVEEPADTGGTKTQQFPLVPDGALTLCRGGTRQQIYLEVDLGTTFATRLGRKVRGYLRVQARGPVIPVFFVVPDEARLELVLAVISREAAALHADPTPFFVTTCAHLTPDLALTGRIWRQVGVSKPVAILPTPAMEVTHAG